MDLRRSAFRGIPGVTDTGGHKRSRLALVHAGGQWVPVEPLERVVVIHPDLRLVPLMDGEVLVNRGVGPDDPLRGPEVRALVAPGERRSYHFAQVAPGCS